MTKDLIKLEIQRQKAIKDKKYDKQYEILKKQMSLRKEQKRIEEFNPDDINEEDEVTI